ncbi:MULTISPECIES: CAP domain-containing protein [Legionella]|uniref:CAP domain-containing protein n=1 Tax=Legionella TaxID=445 RepID=UPI001F454FE6|nr:MULTISPECIES: CAP domain-containing protein [Legionella]MCP0912856.1 CAP domain-containing protein [Legionella sp. 27cVA30]
MKTIKWLSFFLLLISSISIAAPKKEVSSPDLPMQKQILYYVNEYRIKHHRAPLKLMSTISVEAVKHSQAMASKRISFGHQHFNERIKHLYKEFKDSRGGAENVAYYKLNAKKLVDAWIASPGHRRNILGNYTITGIGIAHAKKGWAYYTQIFLNTSGIRG